MIYHTKFRKSYKFFEKGGVWGNSPYEKLWDHLGMREKFDLGSTKLVKISYWIRLAPVCLYSLMLSMPNNEWVNRIEQPWKTICIRCCVFQPACACVCMVENNRKHSKIMKKYLFHHAQRGSCKAHEEKWNFFMIFECFSSFSTMQTDMHAFAGKVKIHNNKDSSMTILGLMRKTNIKIGH